jgi:hypothetical protein
MKGTSMTKSIRTTFAAAAVTGLALVLTACGSPEIVSGPSTTAPVAEQPAVDVVGTTPASTPAAAPTPDVDAAQAAWEKLDAAIAAGDTATASALTAPGSAAAIYANTTASLVFSNPSTATPASSSTVRLGGPVTVDPAGLITDLTRNGTPVSQLVAGPSGEILTVNPGTVDYGNFTGEATAKVLGYRWFDGSLQIIFDVTNNSDGSVYVQGSSYISGGRQFEVSGDGSFTAPGVTRSTMLTVRNAPVGQGGTLNAQINVNFMGKDQPLSIPSIPGV